MQRYTVRITLTLDLDVEAQHMSAAIGKAEDYINGCDFGEMYNIRCIESSIADRKIVV